MPRVLFPKLRTITVIFKRLQGFPFVSYLYLIKSIIHLHDGHDWHFLFNCKFSMLSIYILAISFVQINICPENHLIYRVFQKCCQEILFYICQVEEINYRRTILWHSQNTWLHCKTFWFWDRKQENAKMDCSGWNSKKIQEIQKMEPCLWYTNLRSRDLFWWFYEESMLSCEVYVFVQL